MKIRLALAFYFVLMGHVVFGQIPESSITIRGTVKDSISGKPVEFATLLFLPINNSNPPAGALANENGAFEITKLPAGKYF
ncbi:MAG: carboxypeptidase-like regulatory domain-containing protein, partial [Cytophagales bacterium]|nr:carboxypeptidase-like regulatory domain-containing protein [Cytophagales bacterium]